MFPGILKIFVLLVLQYSFLNAQPTKEEWLILQSPTNNTLRKLHFVDSTTGWASGINGTIIHTTNGGTDWEVQFSNVSTTVHEIFFLNENLGWALTFKDSSPFGTSILKTSDGGDNWVVTDFPVTNALIYTIFFFDSSNGLIGGKGLSSVPGNISYSKDGGDTWIGAEIDSNQVYNFPVYQFKFYNQQFGYACGGRIDLAGVVWRTTNYGMNWTAVGISPDEIFDIFVFDSLNAITLSGDPEIRFGIANLKTFDAGITWFSEELTITGMSFTIDFRTANEGWSASGEKFVFTSDRGQTWIEKETPDSSILYDLQFLDARTGYAVGQDGVILKLNPDAVGVDDEVSPPEEFILFQNYPNPFNQTTRIKFTTPYFGFTILKVYDVLGKLVAELVSEEKPAGNYDVTFDASELTSGIYFYQLRSGGFVQSKKMVYLK